VRGTRLLNKLWNVEKFISNLIKDKPAKKPELIDIDKWILTKYSKLVKKCTEQMDSFDYSQAMKEIEYFLWHELADHYIEMVKSSVYKNENMESINYTLYTLGLGVLKLFAPFFPHIAEEIYQQHFKKLDGCESIHLSAWPEPLIIDEEKETAGEYVKDYISKVRSWKSGQGLALNAPLESYATYAPASIITKIKPSGAIIKSTLNYPDGHEFIAGKPDIEEKIVTIKPVYSKIGPLFKADSKKVTTWINEHQKEIIKKIQKSGDISWADIPGADPKHSKEKLIVGGYLQLIKEQGIKGKKDTHIFHFDDFYVEFKGGKS
jgi:valyl-tRNA synthetase